MDIVETLHIISHSDLKRMLERAAMEAQCAPSKDVTKIYIEVYSDFSDRISNHQMKIKLTGG